MSDQSTEEWRPVLTTPPGGWSFEHLLTGELPKHTELINGDLVMSLRTCWHVTTAGMLWRSLERQAPEEFTVMYDMAVRKSERTYPEPDVCVVRSSADDPDTTWFDPADVLLAVEIIAPRDRGVGPEGQAAAVRGAGRRRSVARRAGRRPSTGRP